MLLLLFGSAVAIGAGTVIFVIRQARRRRRRPSNTRSGEPESTEEPALRPIFPIRPPAWLAVKSRSLLAVQSALGLHNAKPCSFNEGLAGEERLFIAPPVKAWRLVFGAGLPDPRADGHAAVRCVLRR